MGSDRKKSSGFRRVNKPSSDDDTASTDGAIQSDASSAASSKLSLGMEMFEQSRKRRAQARAVGGSKGSGRKSGAWITKTNLASIVMISWLIFYVGNEYTNKQATKLRGSASRASSSSKKYKTREERDAAAKRNALKKPKALSSEDRDDAKKIGFKPKTTADKPKKKDDEEEETEDNEAEEEVKKAAGDDGDADAELASLATGPGTDLWSAVVAPGSSTESSTTEATTTGADSTTLLATATADSTEATDPASLAVGATAMMTNMTAADGTIQQTTSDGTTMMQNGMVQQATDGTTMILQQPTDGTAMMQTANGMMQQPTDGTTTMQQPLAGTTMMQTTNGMMQQTTDGTMMMQQATDGTPMMQTTNGMMLQTTDGTPTMQTTSGMMQQATDGTLAADTTSTAQGNNLLAAKGQIEMPQLASGSNNAMTTGVTMSQTGAQQAPMDNTMMASSTNGLQSGTMQQGVGQGNAMMNQQGSLQTGTQQTTDGQLMSGIQSNGMLPVVQGNSNMIQQQDGSMASPQMQQTSQGGKFVTQQQTSGFASNGGLIQGPGFSDGTSQDDGDKKGGNQLAGDSLESAGEEDENAAQASLKKAFAKQNQQKTESLVQHLNQKIVEDPGSYQPDKMGSIPTEKDSNDESPMTGSTGSSQMGTTGNGMAMQSNSMGGSTQSGTNQFQQASQGSGQMQQSSVSQGGQTGQTQMSTGGNMMTPNGNAMNQMNGGMQQQQGAGSMMSSSMSGNQMSGTGMMQQQGGTTNGFQQGNSMIQPGNVATSGTRPQYSQQNRRLQEIPMNFPQEIREYDHMSDAEIYQYVTNHPKYSNLLNVDEALPFNYHSQVPYFWHIHKSGGTTVKHIMACLGMAQTRRMNVPGCSDQEREVKVCPPEYGNLYVNADASSPPGIARLAKFGLTNLDAPTLVVDSSRVYEALDVLAPEKKGRLFVVLRDPMERAFSKYSYNKIATWERNYRPEIANMTVQEYVASKHCLDNWIVRRLVHKMDMTQRVTDSDFKLAKEVIRRKALVLLTEFMDHSSFHFTRYFGINITPQRRECVDHYAKERPENQNPHSIPLRDSPEWSAMQSKHLYDIELYRFAVERYHGVQAQFLDKTFGQLHLPSRTSADDPVVRDEDDY